MLKLLLIRCLVLRETRRDDEEEGGGCEDLVQSSAVAIVDYD